MPHHPIEQEQRRLLSEIPDDASVIEGIAQALGREPDAVMVDLISRQLIEADKHVEDYVVAMRSVRRAATGCGFVAGVTFAVAVLRLRERGESVSAS